MDDVHIVPHKKDKTLKNLLGKLADQIERNAPKICVSYQVVEVVREELEDDHEMVSMLKMVEDTD